MPKLELNIFMKIFQNLLPLSGQTDTVIGLDIGACDVKYAEFKADEANVKWILDKCAVIALSKTPDEKERNKEIALALKGIFSGKNIRRTKITCLINDINCIQRRILTPLMSRGELKEAIHWKMKDFIHFSLEDAVVDFKITGQVDVEGEKKDEILAVAFSKKAISQYCALFKEARLVPASFVSLVSCIEFSLSRLDSERETTVAFVDLGAGHSELVIFKNGQFSFSRQLPVNGDGLTKALSAVLDGSQGRVALTFEEAERLKKEFGIPKASNEIIAGTVLTCNQVFSLLRPEIEKLASEIEHSFAYYREEFGSSNVDSLILIGAGSALKGLDTFLSKQLNMPVKAIDPFKDILPESEIDLKEKNANPPACFFACIGAAKNFIDNITFGKEDINLVPLEIKEQDKLLIKRLILELIITLVVLGGLLSILWVKFSISAVNKKIGAIGTQVYSLGYKQRLASLKGFINQIYEREPRWSDLWREISNCVPANIYLEHILYSNDELVLEGVVISKSESSEGVLSNLVLALEKGIFKNVSLIESKNIKDNAALVKTEFRLKCQVE